MFKCKTYSDSVVVFRLLIMLLCCCLIAVDAAAMEKTSVFVEFKMPDKEYRDFFSDQELPGMLIEIASAIAEELQKKIVYLKFAQEDDSRYKLKFRIDRADAKAKPGQGEDTEFLFFVTLSRLIAKKKDASGYQRYEPIEKAETDWVFRKADEYNKVPGRRNELTEEIRRKIKPKTTILVKDVLHHIPFTKKNTKFIKVLKGWIIGYSPSDLCMAENSLIKLYNKISKEGYNFVLDYEAKVVKMLQPEQNPEQIYVKAVNYSELEEELEKATSIVVESVHVLEYIHRCPDEPEKSAPGDSKSKGSKQ